MSRAFVKEPDGEEVALELPDRPISAHRNFVTERGLAQIDEAVQRARKDLGSAQTAGDKQAVATASRDLRYWTSRRASAELVAPSAADDIRFGSTVTIERGDGRRQTFRLTGEDEADPAQGTLSYVAPLARVLIGKDEGEEFVFQNDTILISSVAGG